MYLAFICLFIGIQEPSAGMIILYDIATLIITIIFGYLWGWFSRVCRLEDNEKYKISPFYWLFFGGIFFILTILSIYGNYNVSFY